MLAMQIAVGIWLGGLMLGGTVWAGCAAADKIIHNRRFGAPWWRGLTFGIGR